MKLVGGIIAWIGGMATLLGLLFYFMSLKNTADLFVWTLIGRIVGVFGLILLALGGLVYAAGVFRIEIRRQAEATQPPLSLATHESPDKVRARD